MCNVVPSFGKKEKGFLNNLFKKWIRNYMCANFDGKICYALSSLAHVEYGALSYSKYFIYLLY